MARFGVLIAGRHVVAEEVSTRPVTADTLAAAERTVARQVGMRKGEDPRDVLEDAGLRVVPATYAIEGAYKSLVPRGRPRLRPTGGPVFRAVIRYVEEHDEVDAVGLSLWSWDWNGLEGVEFVKYLTASTRLADMENDRLVVRLPWPVVRQERSLRGYPPTAYRSVESDPPALEAVKYEKTGRWPAWLARYRREYG